MGELLQLQSELASPNTCAVNLTSNRRLTRHVQERESDRDLGRQEGDMRERERGGSMTLHYGSITGHHWSQSRRALTEWLELSKMSHPRHSCGRDIA